MSLPQLFLLGMDRSIPEPLPMPTGLVLNLGAGNKVIDGTVPLDWPTWDADKDPLPYRDGEVHGIHCYHFLEHVAHPVAILIECQRVLKPYGLLQICVPYYKSNMAAQDLDHKSFFTEDTWKTLFNNPYYKKHRVDWKFEVHLNVIMGVAERNLCLLTQLVRLP